MLENYIETKTKTNLILKQIKKSKKIRCHRTWTRELAVSCPSTIVHVGGGRSSPLNF